MGEHASSVISLEFNELCPNLMTRFMQAGELPQFKRFHDEAVICETDAEASGELLNPWVQWVSAHTGLSTHEHQVTALSEGHKVTVPAVWDILSSAGRRVWVCGSMNTRFDKPLNGYLLPDPWSTGTPPYPAGEFDHYLDYVRSAVQEHTHTVGKGSMKTFLRYMVGHGLSIKTMLAVVRQLVSERFVNTRWKRACILDLFQWDLFRHYYCNFSPNFATFFLNSTAHLQHCYWRNMEPEKFQSKPPEGEQHTYADAILFGYKRMDRLVGQFLKLAGKKTILVFSTALSQQPYLDHQEKNGRHYYHLHDRWKLIKPLALREEHDYEPVMAEQFYLRFRNEEELSRAQERLANFHVKHPSVFKDDRTRLFHLTRKDCALLVQCRCTSKVPPEAAITLTNEPGLSIPFYDVFYQMPAMKSGRHHPTGMLWLRYPDCRHRIHSTVLPLRSFAPTILRLFGIQVPEYMQAKSLVDY